MGISIRILRPMYLRGLPCEPGELYEAEPTDAAMAVATGRAEFVSREDAAAANAGVVAADEKACAVSPTRVTYWSRKAAQRGLP